VKVRKLPPCGRDLAEIAEFIRRQSGAARAVRFLRSAEETIQRLASMPGLGARYEPGRPIPVEIRFLPITRHRSFLVFYRIVPDGVEILRIIHGARDLDRLIAAEFGTEEDSDDDAPEPGPA
jgi:toxin ParE1/3/4